MEPSNPQEEAIRVVGRKAPKKRGRALTTGTCATRDDLCREVRWYYNNTSMSIEAIGKRFGVSQKAAAGALEQK